MKKRNRKYNPNKHRLDTNSAFKTIRLAKPITDESKVLLNEQIHAALDAITKGYGIPEHFDVLASTVDIVFMMAMNLFNNAYQDEIEQARKAMFRLKDRFHRTGKFGFDGEGYNAIKQIVLIHDEILNQVTGAEMLAFMKARAHALKNGNYYKGSAEKLAA
jgi:hypothetical protein